MKYTERYCALLVEHDLVRFRARFEGDEIYIRIVAQLDGKESG